jgi:hypothetical protein
MVYAHKMSYAEVKKQPETTAISTKSASMGSVADIAAKKLRTMTSKTR